MPLKTTLHSNRIDRKLNFFKKNVNLIFTLFWVFISVGMFLASNEETNKGWFLRFLTPVLYAVAAILYLIAYLLGKQKRSEYIEWSADELIMSRAHQKSQTYLVSEIQNLTITKNHLIVKYPKAKGTMANLNGYTEEGLEQLRSRFANFQA